MLSIAALVAVVHLVASAIGGYWFDEVYILTIGHHQIRRVRFPPVPVGGPWQA